MPDLILLSCQTCTAKLKIASNTNFLICENCGNQYIVNRNDGVPELNSIAETLKAISLDFARMAAEYAIVRLKKDIADAEAELATLTKWHEEESGKEAKSSEALQDNFFPVLGATILLGLVGLWFVTGEGWWSLMIGVFLVVFSVSCWATGLWMLDEKNKKNQQQQKIRAEKLKPIKNLLHDKNEILEKKRKIADS